MYVAHKYDYHKVKESLLSVSEFVKVLDLESQTVIDMLSSEWKDYEDATQNLWSGFRKSKRFVEFS